MQALSEFEEAYRVSPNPLLLYNLGQIHAELGHAVEAVDAYERFLREAREADEGLRRDVRQALAGQRARVGALALEVSVPGARVFVDDVERGATPLGELAVSAGEHVVSIQAAGFETQRHRFRVAGNATYRVALTLVPSGTRSGSLRIESRVPGVEIRVDGTSMGLTPLDSTVPVTAGPHRVEGIREGYTPYALEVNTLDGSETRVVVQTGPDPAAPAATRAPLRIRVPDPSSTLEIDGERLEAATETQVPVGLHDVQIHAAEREPIALRVDVLPGEGLALEPAYRWTPDARAARLASAESQRTSSLISLIGGGVALAAGVSILAWDIAVQLPSLEERADDANTCADLRGGSGPCDTALDIRGLPDGSGDAFVAQYQSDQSIYYGLLSLGIGLTAVGGIAAIVGAIFFADAPSTADIDRAARADLSLEPIVGLDRVGVRGRF